MTCLDKCKSKGVIVTGINVRQCMSSVFMLAIRILRAEHDPTLAFKEYFQRPHIQYAEALSKVEIYYTGGDFMVIYVETINFNGGAILLLVLIVLLFWWKHRRK